MLIRTVIALGKRYTQTIWMKTNKLECGGECGTGFEYDCSDSEDYRCAWLTEQYCKILRHWGRGKAFYARQKY